MDELKAALIALIDERLAELGLTDNPADAPAAPKRGGKGGKKSGSEDEITADTLREKVTALVKKKGKDAAKALLKKAKVEKLSELPEKNYAKFNDLLDKELAEEDEEDLFGD